MDAIMQHPRPLHTEKGSRSSVGAGASEEGRYTLDMVKIDRKVREVISQIKIAEAAKANAQNKIDAAAPQVSVAT